MIGLSLRTRRHTARGLLTLLASLWLLTAAAPCVMAASHCPNVNGEPCESMVRNTGSTECDNLQAVDCQREDVALSGATTFDTQPVPVLLARAPATATQPVPVLALDPDRLARQLSPPPLYLQHAVLLI
jgi:hypothetical protein